MPSELPRSKEALVFAWGANASASPLFPAGGETDWRIRSTGPQDSFSVVAGRGEFEISLSVYAGGPTDDAKQRMGSYRQHLIGRRPRRPLHRASLQCVEGWH